MDSFPLGNVSFGYFFVTNKQNIQREGVLRSESTSRATVFNININL